MELHIHNNCHLGDCIIALLICYNETIFNVKKVKVYGPCFSNKIIDNFDFKIFEYCGETNYKEHNQNVSKFFNVECHTCGFNWKYFSYESKNNIFEKIYLPEIKNKTNIEEKKIQYFQFDSRSSRKDKPKIDKKIVEIILRKNFDKNFPIFGIGGLDTKKEYNYNYHLGDIDFIIKKFNQCKKFIGCDSGMFVLAAMLNLNCEIYMQSIYENCIKQVIQIFEKIFPNVVYKSHPYNEEIIKLN